MTSGGGGTVGRLTSEIDSAVSMTTKVDKKMLTQTLYNMHNIFGDEHTKLVSVYITNNACLPHAVTKPAWSLRDEASWLTIPLTHHVYYH